VRQFSSFILLLENMETNQREEDLTHMWGKFSLMEEENSGVSLETAEIESLVSRGKFCLIGKLLVERVVTKEFYKAPLLRAWRPTGEVFIRVVGENMFVAEFEKEWDKSRIMEGRPWLFDGNLVSLAEFDGLTSPGDMDFDKAAFWVRMYNLPLACMGRGVGFKMGASVGVVEEVDISDGEAGWGEFLRVKIVIDLTKPLARGRLLHIQNRSIWIPFKYEKLPRFCFKCGVVKHGRLGCSKIGSRRTTGEEEYPFGNWLRVSYAARRGVGSYTRFGKARADQDGEVRHPTPGGSASSDGDGVAGDGILCRDQGFPGLGKSQIPREGFLPTVTSSNPGTGMALKTNATFWEKRKGIEENNVQYGNFAVNAEGQLRGSGVSHCNVKGQEIWANKGMEIGKRKDGNGLEDQCDNIQSNSSTESNPDPQKKLQKAQYVGSWDSQMGKMVYHLMGEGGTVVQLAKDPNDNTYFPHVTDDSGAWLSSDHTSLKDKANSSDVNPKSEKLSTTKLLDPSSDPRSVVSRPASVKGKSGSWKKRARDCANTVTILETHANGREAGEAVVSASLGDHVATKKNRRSITLAPHEQKQQAVAGVQPRPEQ
jgi:hypothetical protein